MTAEPTLPPPRAGMAWPAREVLGTTGTVLARPRMGDAAATAAMQRDPRLWVDVPESFRVTSTTRQEDDFRHFLSHWREHGFGYWLVWEAGTGPDGPASLGDGEPANDDPAPAPGPIGLGGLRWLWWQEHWVLNVYVRFAVAGQGRGLASVLLGRALDRLDRHLAEPTNVVVRTRPENTAMARLAHRLGFDDAGTEQRSAGTYRVLSTTIGGGDPAADRPDRAVEGPDGAGDGSERLDAGGAEPVPTTATTAPRAPVRLRSGGPMVVAGTVPVRGGPAPVDAGLVTVSDPDGRPDQALCRCGRSSTPPHCDRSHRAARGLDTPERFAGPSDPGTVVSGKWPHGPGIVVVDDGPMVVHGTTLGLPDGTKVDGPVAVCRCAGSRTPPWCDGDACGIATR